MLEQVLDGLESAANATELKSRVMDSVAEPLGAGATGLYLFGPDGNVAELHARGVRDGFILAYEQLGRGQDPILEQAIRTHQATHDGMVYRGDGWTRSALYRECGGPWKIKHYLCVPIVSGGRVLGTLNFGRRCAEHPFGPDEMTSATRVSRRIADRLLAFAAEPDGRATPARTTIEDLGRLSAERTHVRIHADALERLGPHLGSDEASALWDAVVARHVTPLDIFEKGDRTYLLLSSPESASMARPAELTRRELEVVRRFAAGSGTKEIAFELGISTNTVGTLVASAKARLGVTSRVRLIEMARRLGLVS